MTQAKHTPLKNAVLKRAVNGLQAGQSVQVKYAGFYDSFNVYVGGKFHSSLHEDHFVGGA